MYFEEVHLGHMIFFVSNYFSKINKCNVFPVSPNYFSMIYIEIVWDGEIFHGLGVI